MLIRFEVSNFRSIRRATELSLVAIGQDRPEARWAEQLGQSLLTVAGVYGPNASGKSNVIAALTWLREAVQNSLRYWLDEIPVEPFAFGDGPQNSSTFELELLIDKVRFEYIVELDRSAVHYEGLFHYPEKRRRRVFEREGTELKLQRGLGSLSGTRELLTDQTLALSVAHRFDQPLVSEFVRAVMRTQTFGLVRRSRFPRIGGPYQPNSRPTVRWFEDPPSTDQLALFEETELGTTTEREQALALLRMADLGIVDVLVDEEEIRFSMPSDTAPARSRRRVRLVHEAAEERAPLDFVAESEGTQIWFQLVGPVLFALRSGALLLFDELDASLHPTLAAHLIGLFHDPATNPKGAQLIFTAHNTSLLKNLSRDQIWLTERNSAAETVLSAIAEFTVQRGRNSQDLEVAYLHGRFGALPDVNELELLQSFRLIG
ncbi:AAA family ATPase [Frankia sp. AgKG'84/4]|uniref:AAA family ATPase n=1 Tax=Frankia sp. AgKG'84/4 TaxID=573490 RepID=UPI00200E1B14|nr:ATP-binding protein [Frankia sp. AgKG'84/4]MCL9795562.1 ATP-binding protein [Frankia sp. AgKG'84/4]